MILASKQLQTYSLYCTATGISCIRDTIEFIVASEIFTELHGAELFSKIDSYCFGKFSAFLETNFCFFFLTTA